MAEKITEKLNELDAGSVTPQDFQKVWGISKEEYLSRMMDYVHKRKAEAAEKAAHEEREDHDEEKQMKEQMAALKKDVEQLKQEVKELKTLVTDQSTLPSLPGTEYVRKLLASKNLGKRDRQNSSRRRIRNAIPHDVARRELRNLPSPHVQVAREI